MTFLPPITNNHHGGAKGWQRGTNLGAVQDLPRQQQQPWNTSTRTEGLLTDSPGGTFFFPLQVCLTAYLELQNATAS